jgi:hypothetical protein
LTSSRNKNLSDWLQAFFIWIDLSIRFQTSQKMPANSQKFSGITDFNIDKQKRAKRVSPDSARFLFSL